MLAQLWNRRKNVGLDSIRSTVRRHRKLASQATADRALAASENNMVGGLRRLRQLGLNIDVFLDVGASTGIWTREAMQVYPESHFVMFEPQPVHYDSLDKTERDLPRAIAVKKAVGANIGTIKFDATDPFGGNLVPEDGIPRQSPNSAIQKIIDVPLTTIDHEVHSLGLSGSMLLKLDTHGYELDILAGSEQTLKRCDALIIETYNYKIAPDCLLFWEMCAHLAAFGFRPIDLIGLLRRPTDNTLWQFDLFLVRDNWPGFQDVRYRT